jgi:hypothetical protein
LEYLVASAFDMIPWLTDLLPRLESLCHQDAACYTQCTDGVLAAGLQSRAKHLLVVIDSLGRAQQL